MKSVYKGLWFPGRSEVTGASFLKGRKRCTSKTLFSIGYDTYGLQCHSLLSDPFHECVIKELKKHYPLKFHYMENVENFPDIDEMPSYPFMYGMDCSTKMVYAENQTKEYIGDLSWAYFLYQSGIYNPELVRKDARTCSIGFSEKDKKWYGWSHRAYYGFFVGSTIKKGDCGYMESDSEKIISELEQEKMYEEIELSLDGKSVVYLSKRYLHRNPTPEISSGEKKDYEIVVTETYEWIPEHVKVGRGEWTAKTMDDAKEMAKEFAMSVS